jgi:glycosyl transferase family 4
MRILILSWYFPPINEIGALRVGKLAQFLNEHGHEVWVVTAKREGGDRSLSAELPADRVIRTDWRDIDKLTSPWGWISSSPSNEAQPGARPLSSATKTGMPLRSALSETYAWLVRFPDRQGGWRAYALRAGMALMKRNAFDLIYASSPPFTTLLVAAGLSRRSGVPWVAEYRDAWNKNHYIPKPRWRETIDIWLERRVTSTASGIVTATQPWAEHFGREFGKPTLAVYNGFDETNESQVPPLGSHGLPLTIAHMGTTYAGRRSPHVLFEAIKAAGISPAELQVAFYGEKPGAIFPAAEAAQVAAFVKVPDRVPYQDALDIQRKSDVLLLLQSQADWANIPAKLFEYFGAQRPILGLGTDDGIAAHLIRERNAGFYRTDAHAISERLKAWIAEKRQTGRIAALPHGSSEGLSRREQLKGLEAFLASLARVRAGTAMDRPVTAP